MTKKHLFQNGLALFVCLFMFAGALFAQSQTEVIQYTSGGQWEVPNDVQVTSVTFEAWGGGGAGGYAYSTNSLIRATGGGGGGAYAKVTIDNPAAGDVYDITVGQGGHATGSYTENPDIADGGNSVVTRGTVDILKAVGGKTVTGYKNENGAMGGSSADCIGTVKYSGGNGADACPGLFGAWSTSGGGGGGAGKTANGGDGGTEVACAICLTHCTIYNVESVGAGGAGNPNGNGGVGKKTRIFSGDGWVNIQGGAGSTYGGGGGGSVSGQVSAGDANGGQGGNGIVIVTYTYIDQTIEVADVEEYLCPSNTYYYTSYNFPLNVQVSGFQLKDALVNNIGYDNITAETGLMYTTPTITYNNTENRWYISGTLRNPTTSPLTLTIPVTALTANSMAWDEFTVTIHAYGQLNGGKIEKNQYLCFEQEANQLVNVVSAAGGAVGNNPTYQWQMKAHNAPNSSFTDITGANGENYMPGQLSGHMDYRRAVIDEQCNLVKYAEDNDYPGYYYIEILNPNPMDPGMIQETQPGEICPDENFNETIYSHYSGVLPEGSYGIHTYWQRKVNDGDWQYIEGAWSTGLAINLTPNVWPMRPGYTIQYRYMISLLEGIETCDRIPSNNVYTITVKDVPNYTDQFEDETITLWYGACDTSIANLAKPVLTPTPAEITGPTCDQGLRLAPGTYTITWEVKPYEDCALTSTYEQQLTVEFPKCGTLDEPYIVKDRDGNEYNTIRIGCDCWFAENLRSNADNATYYDEDDANEDFGKLYDWNDAVGSFNEEMETKLGTTYIQGVCPMGWAVSTVAQYNTMFAKAGGTTNDIKSDDQNTWLPGNAGTNASGFAAMGAGYYEAMQYQRMLGYTYYWTADLNESNNTVAKVMELRCGCDQLTCTEKNKESKVSMRCVKVEPLNYININIAFDMNDSWGDGWNGAYLLAEYGASSVKIVGLGSHNECTIPVPQGSDVSLTWYGAWFDYEISFTVTNEATEEVVYEAELGDLTHTSDGTELTTFHVDGACNPEDLQVVNFVLKEMYSGNWDGGILQVDYGTGVMNLTKPTGNYQAIYTIELPVGAHITLNYITGAHDSENFFTVEYPDGTVIFNAPTVDASLNYEFDVEKK